MSDARGLPEHRVLQQAAQWFATLSDETVSNEERRQWQLWLDTHPDHRKAWRFVERVDERFQLAQQRAGQDGASRILHTARGDRVTRRKLLGAGIGGIAALLALRHTGLPLAAQRLVDNWRADQRTGLGEVRELTLACGGQLWMNSASAVDIRYRPQLRELLLHDGEILIQTAHDAQRRPFVVSTAQGRLRALGTRFCVQQRDDSSLLAVFDGAVEITTRHGAVRILKAGEQCVFSADGIAPPQPAQHARQSWSRGLIVADDMRLDALVQELRRYRHGYLGVDPTLADLKVMGSFPIDKPDHALAMLADALPLRIHRVLPWWVSLEPRS